MSGQAPTSPATAGVAVPREGEWVVTLDIENAGDPGFHAELAVRALSAAVAGSRTYVAARTDGYSFTVFVGTPGAESALGRALDLLEAAQVSAELPAGAVVCAEVTLVGTRPVPAASASTSGCENPAP